MISAEESSQELAGPQDTFVVGALNADGDRVYLMPSGRWTSLLREALQFEAKGAVQLDVRRLESISVPPRSPSGGVVSRSRSRGSDEAA